MRVVSLILVFVLASVANATLSWNVSDINVTPEVPQIVYIVSDSSLAYTAKWIDDTGGLLISNIIALPPSDPPEVIISNPYPGGWTVESGDNPYPGNHFEVTLEAGTGQAGNTYSIYMDVYGSNDKLDVTVVPEPMSIFLLAFGGLALLRKHR